MGRFDDEDERFRREYRARMNATLIITSILSFFISFAILMAMQDSKQGCTVQPCESCKAGSVC